MRSRSFLGLNARGFHRLHYTERGDVAAPSVVCVHGLTQTARTFDHLAETRAPTPRVACLGVVWPGRSDWLPAPPGSRFPQHLPATHAPNSVLYGTRVSDRVVLGERRN